MVNHSWSTGDLEPKTAYLPKPTKSKAKKEHEGHNFFKAVALLANHNWDEDFLSSPPTNELVSSHLLDESFQERLELFIHQPPLKEQALKTSLAVNQAMSLVEKSVLSKENVIEFHQKMRALASDNSPWPMMLCLNNQSNWCVADRGRLFCSLRLKKKSLQVKSGADPKTRYFHMAIRDSKRPLKKVDLLYWLQFDEEQNPIKGGFISGFQSPQFLLTPAQVLAYFNLDEQLCAPVPCMLNKALKLISRQQKAKTR